MEILSEIYHVLFPSLYNECGDLYLPRSFRRMNSITIHGQKLQSGQYKMCLIFHAQIVLPCIGTIFNNSNVRPAQIAYFVIHSVQISDANCITNAFAVVNWPMRHPLHTCIGTPYQVWCNSLFVYIIYYSYF